MWQFVSVGHEEMMIKMLDVVAFCLQINYGGTVPKSYYVQDSVKVQYDNSVTISRGSNFQLEYDVSAPNSLLRYIHFSHLSDQYIILLLYRF